MPTRGSDEALTGTTPVGVIGGVVVTAAPDTPAAENPSRRGVVVAAGDGAIAETAGPRAGGWAVGGEVGHGIAASCRGAIGMRCRGSCRSVPVELSSSRRDGPAGVAEARAGRSARACVDGTLPSRTGFLDVADRGTRRPITAIVAERGTPPRAAPRRTDSGPDHDTRHVRSPVTKAASHSTRPKRRRRGHTDSRGVNDADSIARSVRAAFHML